MREATEQVSLELKVQDSPELKAIEKIEKSKADSIQATFAPMAAKIKEFESEFNAIQEECKNGISDTLSIRAKSLRKAVSQVRIETGKLKDKKKKTILIEGNAIMAVHNIVVWSVKEIEDALKEIENAREIAETKRLAELQVARATRLAVYAADAFDRDLIKFEDDEFEAFFSMKKKAFEENEEAEKVAEEARIKKEKEEIAERKRIEEENAKLRKEAILKKEQDKIESAKREKAEAARIAKEKAAQDKLDKEAEAKRKKEAEDQKEKDEANRKEKARIQKIADDKAIKEKARRDKIEADLKAKQDALAAELKKKEEAERKAEEEKERQARKEEQAKQEKLKQGDAGKVEDLIYDLTALKGKYKFDSAKNIKMSAGVDDLLKKVITYIQK